MAIIPIIGTTAKLATVVLLLAICACVSPSSTSRAAVTPSEMKNTVADGDAREMSSLVPKRGTGVVMITAQAAAAALSSINGTSSSSVESHCGDVCNDTNCANYYPDLCKPEDLGRCSVGCACADVICHCICSY